jgi:ABC-type transport system substrate-binding protein
MTRRQLMGETMRIWRYIAMFLFVGCLAGEASAQNTISEPAAQGDADRREPRGTIKNAGWFNIWAINAGGQSTGLHQLGMDTFWYIDPQKGVDGVWDNSLASEKPIYNADFTEMTVKLRKGIFWSDGVEFSAADVVYTIQTHMKTNGLRWSAPVQVNVADGLGARRQHRRLQAEEAQLALPRAVHGALERHVDDAKHVFEKAATSSSLRTAGDAAAPTR